MADEQTLQVQLVEKFPFLHEKVRIQRVRRMYAAVPAENIAEVFDHVVKEMQFSILCAITGLDQGETLGLQYHLARVSGEILTLLISVPRQQPVVRSVTPYFPAADVYEREVVDLLGFQVQGLVPGNRYPLPDGWPAGQYPLRKDWKADSLKQGGGKKNEVADG
jgi:Ni,Fe-hydrogenase III component G